MTFLYVGNAGTQNVSAFRIDTARGSLAPVGTFEVPAMESNLSSPLAATPDGRILFVAVRNRPWSVASFAIDPSTGELHHLGAGPLADDSCYMSCDRNGRFLLTASYGGNKIAVNPIGTEGIVGPPQQVIDTEPHSHAILVDTTNRHALSACLGADRVYQWRFDADSGRLTPNDPPFVPVARGSGPRHFVFHPKGTFVYVLNELAPTIYVYAYDADHGTLHQKQVVEAWTREPGRSISASDVQITPDGKFLYASERCSSALAMFTVGREGTLSLVGHVVTETQPRGFAIDPSGRFLYSTGQLSGRMSCYEIHPESGSLTRIGDYRVGQNPNWVEIVERTEGASHRFYSLCR